MARYLGKSIVFTMIFALLISLVGPMSFAANDEITLIINGEQIQSDVPPQLIDNRTMVPVRIVSETLEALVRWDQQNSVVYINTPADVALAGTSDIQLVIDGKVIESDVAPQPVDNRTLVPLRVISEALGASVNWDQQNGTVTITANNSSGGGTVEGAS